MNNSTTKSTKRGQFESFENKISDYVTHLNALPLSQNSKKQYISEVKNFVIFLNGDITVTTIEKYREFINCNFKATTANTKMIAINAFLSWNGNKDLKLKLNRIQPVQYTQNTLSIKEVNKMLHYASVHRPKTYYIMLIITHTGIRVGELQYITVESLRTGSTLVDNKGKVREVCLPYNLCIALSEYCDMNHIETGSIIKGRNNRPLTPSAIWKNIQYIAKQTGVDLRKAHPHNFRHFFASEFIKTTGSVMHLADVLGHTNLNTTRLYTRTTITEMQEILENVSSSWKSI